MRIDKQERDDVTVFVLEGRVDNDGAVDLDRALLAAVSAGNYRLVLEMAQVRYINSAGLRILADILTQTREHNGDLKLADPNPKVKRVFQIIGFDNFFITYDTLEEAVTAFSI
ncbi:MAG: STAS domain-containing protein [Chloroflexi bacterium]|nr:STAS domain-containing protein [Chloroflexota bacterium]